MSRFSTPGEVWEYAIKAAAYDLKMHNENGVDLNPFSTQGARRDWQRGFDNAGPETYVCGVEFDTIYQRGRAAAVLCQGQ